MDFFKDRVLETVGISSRTSDEKFDHGFEKLQKNDVFVQELFDHIELFSSCITNLISTSLNFSSDMKTFFDTNFDEQISPIVTKLEGIFMTFKSNQTPSFVEMIDNKVFENIRQIKKDIKDLRDLASQRDQNRLKYDHYLRKIKSLRDEHDKKLSKNKPETPKEIERLERNESKFSEAENEYKDSNENCCKLFDQFENNLTTNMIPIFGNLLQTICFFFSALTKQLKDTNSLFENTDEKINNEYKAKASHNELSHSNTKETNNKVVEIPSSEGHRTSTSYPPNVSPFIVPISNVSRSSSSSMSIEPYKANVTSVSASSSKHNHIHNVGNVPTNIQEQDEPIQIEGSIKGHDAKVTSYSSSHSTITSVSTLSQPSSKPVESSNNNLTPNTTEANFFDASPSDFFSDIIGNKQNQQIPPSDNQFIKGDIFDECFSNINIPFLDQPQTLSNEKNKFSDHSEKLENLNLDSLENENNDNSFNGFSITPTVPDLHLHLAPPFKPPPPHRPTLSNIFPLGDHKNDHNEDTSFPESLHNPIIPQSETQVDPPIEIDENIQSKVSLSSAKPPPLPMSAPPRRKSQIIESSESLPSLEENPTMLNRKETNFGESEAWI